ncbi:unnamed protein product (macronuclear) [Paramecium tetraurelia]|uniref:PSI domain-containing protein n=1 Tax=Paramecium tetraurelia TaxID=5888 RepID=A0E207_PARTE|nr:uncharacterized protein GSPATT00022495001 [Paramecium tetraurelia]CAK89324.1 unnamed protein product [Paramecium tetraurelia]|eukprot:XP_001456721.1 hypothetical protein (macronuclear) [Paramecium tetraurelia strain d4-2]
MSQLLCSWNSFKQQCRYETSIYQPQSIVREYCDQFSKETCNKLRPCESCVSNGPCQLYQGYCTHFTGCTAFAEKDNSKCQQISERCITDGVHCVEIGICDSYKTETACKQDMNRKWCFWDKNTTKCRYPEKCEELPKTFTQDSQCKSQISDCESSQQGGCQDQTIIQQVSTTATATTTSTTATTTTTTTSYNTNPSLNQCKDFTSDSECIKNLEGSPCYWNENLCKDKICSIAPKTFTTNKECSTFLSFCITMSGGGCMNNGTCQVANTSQACVKDIFGVGCFWTANGGCIYKNCDLAPTTLTSNQDCDSFLKDVCVVKEGGGCRNKECEDLFGSSHGSCWTQKNGCTVGLNSKCAKIKNCEDTALKGACIEGLNGPCLWVNNQFSNEQPSGKCYSYNSCQSIQWNTDQQCKQISPFCTTDGTKCVPITQCSETNTNGGCVNGNDGQCIQTVIAIKETQKVCKKFDTCSLAYYLKHEECQNANKKCTSNGLTGCIPLLDCSAYKAKESCKINSNQNSCFWNEVTQTCRDSICSDYNYNTHQQCNSIFINVMDKCTSDGEQCLVISSCTTYKSKSVCNNAQATEGSCKWSEVEPSCKVKQCSDISAPGLDNCSLELGNCTFDGTKCIQWQLCSNYQTKVSCNTMGLDGNCYWSKSGSCQLMTSCKSASDDEQACRQANQKCYWNSNGTCEDHNCDSYYKQHGTCTILQSWDGQSQTFCQEKQGTCKLVDPITLNQLDCYKVSNYLYTWNPTTSKCAICNAKIKPTNNTNKTNTSTNSNNTSNNTNSTTVNNTNTTNSTDSSDNVTNQESTSSSSFIKYFVLFILTVLISS